MTSSTPTTETLPTPSNLNEAERALYAALNSPCGRVVTKAQLVDALGTDAPTTRKLDVLADSLRAKLRESGHPLRPTSVQRAGYRLDRAPVQ